MHNITLIPGDGIGPEIIWATKKIIDATGIKINWDIQQAGAEVIEKYGTPLPKHVLESIKKNKVALKGPITTPIGTGFRSVNVALRKELDLYVNLRPSKTITGIKSKYKDIDIVVVRENTEDVYVGVEHMVGEDAAESIKIITRKGCKRIVRFAFEYAIKHGRKKVTAVHKANIMKCTDGLFLETARDIACEYPNIKFEDIIVDAMSMMLVQQPENFDVMVMPNLYGDILSDLCSGLVGGLGISPSANIGEKEAIFEAVHGSAPDLAGKNIANPTAIILSSIMMLKYIKENEKANLIENAIIKVIAEGKNTTYDLGGKTGTLEFANAVIEAF